MHSNKQLFPVIVFIFLCIMGVIFSFINPLINHDKFYDDSYRIVSVDSTFGFNAGSYQATAYVLQPLNQLLDWFGVDIYHYSLAQNADFFFINLVYMIIYFIPFFVIWHRYKPKFNAIILYAMAIMLILYSPFYGVPNKDIIPFFLSFFSLMAYYSEKKKLAIFLLIAFMTFYALFFSRQYYLIFVVIICTHILTNHKIKWLIPCYAVGLLTLKAMFTMSFFTLIFMARPENNIDITNTWIHYYFYDYEFWGFIMNRVFEFIRLNIPIELLKMSPKYIPHVVFQLITTWYMVRAFIKKKEIDSLTLLSALVIFAFTVAQSFFEPDFGSYFRHKLAIFPFIYILIRNSPELRHIKTVFRKSKYHAAIAVR